MTRWGMLQVLIALTRPLCLQLRGLSVGELMVSARAVMVIVQLSEVRRMREHVVQVSRSTSHFISRSPPIVSTWYASLAVSSEHA